MKIKIPQSSIGQAGVQQVNVGEVKLGPVQVGRLTLNQVHVGISTGKALLRGVSVSLGLKFSLDWTFSIAIDGGIGLLPALIKYKGALDLGALAMNIPLPDIPLPRLDALSFDIKSLPVQDVKAVIGPITNLKLGKVLAERIQAQGLVAPDAGFQVGGLGLGNVSAQRLALPDAKLSKVTVGRVVGGSVPIPTLTIPGLALPPAPVKKLSVTNIHAPPEDFTASTPKAGAGLFTASLAVTVSAGLDIAELLLDSLQAAATVGEIKLENLTLPYEVLDLSLAQVGIDNILVPQVEVN